MSKKEYVCDVCGGWFHSNVSDDDAKAEFEDNFPDCSLDDALIVCDDCYKEIMEEEC